MASVTCVCGTTYQSPSFKNHRKLPHKRCCGQILIGRKWTSHQNKHPDHVGEDLIIPTKARKQRQRQHKERIQCLIGCGASCIRRKLSMHHDIKHQRCRACSRVFIHNQGRLARDKRPEHTCESPEWEDVPLMPDHTLSVFDPQAKYAERIKSVLKKCREMVVNEEDAYWHTNIRLLKEMFPSDNISFAKLGSSAQPSDLIDVYSVTAREAKELLARDQAVTQPILIKGSQNTPDDPMQTLCDRFRLPGSKVSIQDAREKERTPVSMPVDEAIGAIRRETTICGGLPFTILDLEFLGQIPPIPECLHDNRFAVMQAIDSRLQVASRMNEEKTGAGPGKKSSAAVIHGREIDMISSISFSLFAQEGAFTGFHVDTPGGTWVRIMSGLKAWIFASRTAPINDFQEQGSDWAPDVNVIILEPGDCLIMPTAIPHAVLTIADSWMHGGMFIDRRHILPWIETLIWRVEHPNTSNESVPRQLLSGWGHLKDIFREVIRTLSRDEQDRNMEMFTEREQKLRRLLSCTCAKVCGSTCKCRESQALDGKCNAWCHPGANSRKCLLPD